MKAISMWEPWASLVRCGAKTWETRSWWTAYRGKLLVCASSRKRVGEAIHLLAHWSFQGGLAPLVGKPLDLAGRTWAGVKAKDLNYGHAVAVVNMTDCKPTGELTLDEIGREDFFGDFSRGRFAWKWELIEAIDPFPVKGKQGFFEVDFNL